MTMDMKKINIGAFVIAGAMLMTASGCTDSDFDSKYEDPSKVNQVTISNLMVGVFQKVKDYDVYEYGRFFGFDSQFVGKYAQTFGYSYSGGMYSPRICACHRRAMGQPVFGTDAIPQDGIAVQ